MEKSDKFFENYAMIIAVVIMVILICVEWVVRLFGGTDLAAIINQIMYWCYGYMAFIALAWCAKTGVQMKLDVIPEKYPPVVRRIVEEAMQILVIAMAVLMLIICIQEFAGYISDGTLNETIGAPVAILAFAPILGFGLTIVRSVINLFSKKNFNKKGTAE